MTDDFKVQRFKMDHLQKTLLNFQNELISSGIKDNQTMEYINLKIDTLQSFVEDAYFSLREHHINALNTTEKKELLEYLDQQKRIDILKPIILLSCLKENEHYHYTNE